MAVTNNRLMPYLQEYGQLKNRVAESEIAKLDKQRRDRMTAIFSRPGEREYYENMWAKSDLANIESLAKNGTMAPANHSYAGTSFAAGGGGSRPASMSAFAPAPSNNEVNGGAGQPGDNELRGARVRTALAGADQAEANARTASSQARVAGSAADPIQGRYDTTFKDETAGMTERAQHDRRLPMQRDITRQNNQLAVEQEDARMDLDYRHPLKREGRAAAAEESNHRRSMDALGRMFGSIKPETLESLESNPALMEGILGKFGVDGLVDDGTGGDPGDTIDRGEAAPAERLAGAVPPEVRSQIEEALRSRGLAVNDKNIQTLYARMRGGQ